MVSQDQYSLCLKPHIPVGGRLEYFLKAWENITNDQWVLSIIEEEYKLEFKNIPPFSGLKITSVQQSSQHLIQEEITSFLRKDTIEKDPWNQAMEGFYSTFFLVSRCKTGF